MKGSRTNDDAPRRRGSSSSTIRAIGDGASEIGTQGDYYNSAPAVVAKIWVHDDKFSTEDILINEAILQGSGIRENDLIEITNPVAQSDVRDFEHDEDDPEDVPTLSRKQTEDGDYSTSVKLSRYLCLAKFAQAEFKAKQVSLQISIKSTIAAAFGFQNGTQVQLKLASFEERTASHVEFVFRDAYLARSDMWRLIGQELAGKTAYLGQRITFLGSIKLIVKSIHVGGHKASTAYFSGTTVPIFRSEAARYVIFIQMSREMWDFDSEGNGEILFNRVINGFLPDLFKRWTELEVRHLVSIVLFGRHEYRRFDFAPRRDTVAGLLPSSSASSIHAKSFQDFYKVVVTDMASAQWTTILDELKKDFRVFLRDVSLHPPKDLTSTSNFETSQGGSQKRITGRLSSAMKGNILEAINIAATQFSNDYVDRDLIRTGISVVVITAGTGVFEVERDLLNLTSENLTNNGIGIDIVCLSKMPLHSVPLFKYRNSPTSNKAVDHFEVIQSFGTPPIRRHGLQPLSAAASVAGSPAISSANSFGFRTMSRYSSHFRYENPDFFCYGIPQWIDLSYWSPESPFAYSATKESNELIHAGSKGRKGPFVPRVRMYEVQMMGLMEMGMADITIPFILETRPHNSRRRRRKKSSLKFWPDARSLSSSPTWSRKGALGESSSVNPRGLIASGKKLLGDMVREMDEYDEELFKQPIPFRTSYSMTSPDKSIKQAFTNSASSPEKAMKPAASKKFPDQDVIQKEQQQVSESKSPTTSELSSAIGSVKRNPEAARAARSTSYALRGLAPLMRATASTEVNVENAQANMPKPNPVKSRPTVATTAESIRSLSMRSGISLGYQASSSTGSELSQATSRVSDERPTTPIKIKKALQPGGTDNSNLRTEQRAAASAMKSPVHEESTRNHNDSNASGEVSSGESSSEAEDSLDGFSSLPGSVPKSNVPFVRNVNASNPLKRNPNREAYFGRWQHLYPRKPRAATVKWRSLCTPASVPLTTEDFPGRDMLEDEYGSVSYVISLGSSDELLEKPESRDDLYRELLSLRFAHGYQLVVGPRMNKFEGPGVSDQSFFFNPNAVRTDGQFIFMSMGNTIQKLSLIDGHKIQVTRYVKNSMTASPPLAPQLDYDLYIRTILSTEYRQRTMELKGFSEEYPWEQADRFLASPKREIHDEVQNLRFWRARFVLLPVQPPEGAFRSTPTDSEENEEEIHLRGIRALTQMWQRTRYIPSDERRPANNRISSFKKKDRNPLRINMETLNPSELVATELDKLLAAEEAGDVQIAQLLPEEEQFERESAPLAKLAAAIQGERGIEIKNRRWHLRLHYSCFVGEEFTNWLVQNFRDIDTREEAIDLGKALMKEGLFEHVNSRHNFKDGNYFYSIKAEWRLPRADLRQSWFNPTSRKSDRSVPPTPLHEHPARDSPLSVRSRSGSSLATAVGGHPTSEPKSSLLNPQQSKRLSVSLSKVIRLDVDPRRKSNRPEIVNLHYDRLHNPENCYHLELSWLNVTSKLVDDAIVTWTNQAEKYGLKLVELPIVEASRVPEHEPFRAPYRVKLATAPPSKPTNGNNGNVYFTATSFTPHTPVSSDKHFYHKQLLKRFNFVLDLESVSEFPSNVEITYSWGKLTYNYTQYIHRSGVILAQITHEGDVLLLANRLYNSRLASNKDTLNRKDTNTNPSAQGLRPPALPPSINMQASGILGVNVSSPSPNTVGMSSPITRPNSMPIPATAEVFGSKRALSTAGYASYVTPEQIKDDLESFCQDKEKVEMFYREVTAIAAPQPKEKGTPQQQPRTGMGTSSSLLRPVKEGDEGGAEIPEFKLPEAVTGHVKERKTN